MISRATNVAALTIAAAATLMILISGVAGQRTGTSREPFVLELPDISPAGIVNPTVAIGNSDISTLRVRVKQPFADQMDYGSIVLTLNGEGINRNCSKSSDLNGKIVSCRRRENQRFGFDLVPGKNVLEIASVDRQRHEYYASFVLDRRRQDPALAVASGPAETFHGRKFALIMGVSDYKFDDAGLTKLRFADNDARSVAEFLKSPQGGSFKPADITLLVNGEATVSALRGAIKDIARRAGPDDLVFIFIAGHGGPDPWDPQNMYFVFSESKITDLPHTAFPMSELKLALDTQIVAGRVFVVIDTCHSAGIDQQKRTIVATRQLTQAGEDNNISNLYASKQLYKEKGRSIMTSSDVNEVSREAATWNNHGVFTWAMLDGLTGKADANADGMITTGELFAYTRGKVQTETNFEQNPIALAGSATNLVLATVKKR